MQGRIVIVALALVASAFAVNHAGESSAMKACKALYENAVKNFAITSGSKGLYCDALHNLASCAADGITDNMETNKIQNFIDSQQVLEDCGAGFNAKGKSSTVGTEKGDIVFDLPQASDVQFRREQSPETTSIWTTYDNIQKLKANLVKKIKSDVKAEVDLLVHTVVSSLSSSTNSLGKTLSDRLDAASLAFNAKNKQIRDTLAPKAVARESKAAQDTLVGRLAVELSEKDSAVGRGNDFAATLEQKKQEGEAKKVAFQKEHKDVIDSIPSLVKQNIYDAYPMSKMSQFLNPYTDPKVAKFKWKSWATYDQAHGWIFGNRREFFGGVHPSEWTDGHAVAWSMNGDKDQLRQLYTETMFCTNKRGDCHVYSRDTRQYSTTNSLMVSTWMRIKNTQKSNVRWVMRFYVTGCSDGCQGGQQNRASLTINGQGNWHSSHHQCAWCHRDQNIDVPGGRTSSIILIGNGGRDSGDLQTTAIAYDNNCLTLPTGLEWAFDQDIATGGWNN